MNIEKEITEIEILIEKYEDTNNPEDKMDFKQTALKQIKTLRSHLPQSELDQEEIEELSELLEEFEEVLSY